MIIRLRRTLDMRTFMLTPSAGKRLIGRALAKHPGVKKVLNAGTLVIIAGTTNGYVAEEILKDIAANESLNRSRFFRGINLPPGYKMTGAGRLAESDSFPGDVVIKQGRWQKGLTIDDVCSQLKEGDLILKGANALDMPNRRAAIMVGNPNGGTIIPILQALAGKRVGLLIPVGLEKRVPGNLDAIANKLNSPGNQGLRFLPMPGEIFTELEALQLLTGVTAELISSGGVCGAEGCIWLGFTGTESQEIEAEKQLAALAAEPAFRIVSQ
jgi:hypothetical protein